MKYRPPSRRLLILDSYSILLIVYLCLRVVLGGRWWWMGLLNTFTLWIFIPLLPIIALALYWRGKQTALRAMLMFIVGMLLFAPLPIGWLTASNDDHDLRVMTYNIYDKNQRMEQTVDWILAQDADVLILQELKGVALDSQLPRLMNDYPYHVSAMNNVQLFSRLPIIDSEVINLNETGAYHGRRFGVRAVINVDGQAVTVFGVHLNVPFHPASQKGIIERSIIGAMLRYDETQRNQQWRNLANMIAEETNPVIVGGDFNTSHTSPIVNVLADVGMTDAFKAVGTGWGMTWSHNPPALPLLRIDYQWSSEQIQPLRLTMGEFIDEYGSDHLPVIVDYRLGS